MNTISTLQAKIEEAQTHIGAARLELENSPGNFAKEIALSSLELYESQLREQLHSAMIDRDVEVVEFRLKGKMAQDGRLPLDVLSSFALNLHRSIYSAAAYKNSGKVVERMTPSLEPLMEIQFAGIRPGSARIFVSAKTKPDLFGHSLAAETFRATFDLLNADSESMAIKAIEHVGPAGARRFRDLLQNLLQHDLQMDVSWKDPLDKQYSWSGTSEQLKKITSQLGSLKAERSDLINITAVVDGMNQRGRIELKRLDSKQKLTGKLFRVTYSFDHLEIVRDLRLGEKVTAVLRQTKIHNDITKRQQVAYFLQSIKASPPPNT